MAATAAVVAGLAAVVTGTSLLDDDRPVTVPDPAAAPVLTDAPVEAAEPVELPTDVARQRTQPVPVVPDPAVSDRRLDKLVRFKEKVLRELESQKAAARELARQQASATATFRIGTYNILASNLAPRGVERAGISAGLITSRGLDVIGLQEVQPDQQGVLDARMPGYDFFPVGAVGRQDYRKPIGWRTSMFELVDSGAVFYTYVSMSDIPMPWVRLRHRDTGAEFFVIDIHQSPQDLEAERDRSAGVATGLINQLRASGLPVFIVGDMNERDEFFCRVAPATGMVSANGGSAEGGTCRLPPEPRRVDWIMGVDATFSGYVQDGASISSGASDHYFLHATTTIGVQPDPDVIEAAS